MEKFAGIPGTISAEAKRIRWNRLEDTAWGGRAYRADTGDGILVALLSQDPAGAGGKLLWHLSVSHRDRDDKPDRCPNWDELKRAVYELVKADVCMVLIFPRRGAPYVDVHPTTLHLWESDKEIDL
jgi:hypothetical protein